MGRTTLSFSEDELYHLWKNFQYDEDNGAEALMGFAGYPLGASKKIVLPLILKFQKRAEEDAIKAEMGLTRTAWNK